MNLYKLHTSKLKRFGDSKSKVIPTFFSDFSTKNLPHYIIIRKKADIYYEIHSNIPIYPSSLKHESPALFIDEKDLLEVTEKQFKFIAGSLTEKDIERIYYNYLVKFYQLGKHFCPNEKPLVK